jgi:hypothetical protein
MCTIRFFNIPECCLTLVLRSMAASDIGQLGNSCHLAKQRTIQTLPDLRTMLPTIFLIYITTYLKPPEMAKFSSTSFPMSTNLQTLLLPMYSKNEKPVRNGMHRLILRPMPWLFRVYRSETRKWRSLVQFHVDAYYYGMRGELSQWHMIPGLVEVAHRDERLHTLLERHVQLPGPTRSLHLWNVALLNSLRLYKRPLGDLCCETLQEYVNRSPPTEVTNLINPRRCHIM